MLVKKRIIVYVFVESILSILLMCGVNCLEGQVCESYIGLCSIINLLIFLLFLRERASEIFSVASLFVIFMYLFNLGIPIARLFNWVNDDGVIFLARRIYSMGNTIFIAYMLYSYLLISMLQIGVLYYYSKSTMDRTSGVYIKNINYDSQLNKCKTVGMVCIIIGIIPYFYGELAYIKDALIFGYQNADSTFNMSGTGVGLFGNLFLLGIMLEFFYLQKNKKRFDILFYTMCIYQVVRMYITGDRSTGIALILIWVLIRHKFVSPIKGKKAVIYLFLTYAGMLFIKLVEMTRTLDSGNVIEIFHELLQSNMFAETVFEYGGNAWCGMMVYYSVPSTGFFRCGLTYLAAIIGKPLSLLKITDSVWKFSDFSNFLADPARGGLINKLTAAMGGSFSGEWYFNFGWFGIVLIPIFGYFLAKFSDACIDKKKSPVLSGYLMYIATLVIWWVRQYFTSVSWSALFYGVVIWILYELLNSRSKYMR